MKIERDDKLSQEAQNMLQRSTVELYKNEVEKQKNYDNKALTARKIADKAIEEDKWIYFPDEKAWFNPDEFMERFSRTFPNHKILKAMQVRDPAEGMEAGFIRVTELQEKIFSFAKRIIDYYKHKAHGKY